jgi:hypothetical protein
VAFRIPNFLRRISGESIHGRSCRCSPVQDPQYPGEIRGFVTGWPVSSVWCCLSHCLGVVRAPVSTWLRLRWRVRPDSRDAAYHLPYRSSRVGMAAGVLAPMGALPPPPSRRCC